MIGTATELILLEKFPNFHVIKRDFWCILLNADNINSVNFNSSNIVWTVTKTDRTDLVLKSFISVSFLF